MNDNIRVLIVDDSALMREALKVILESDPAIEVVGMAKDGCEGVEKALALKPDVITMDLKMPVMTGLDAIEKIMEEQPIPIIVVSSMDKAIVVKALSIGAMDFISVTEDIETISADILDKVKIASRVKPIRRFKQRSYVPKASKAQVKSGLSKVVAIGVSTGGPQALQEILAKVPKDLKAGILIVQHISKGFIDGLAEWLNATSCMHVSIGKAGDRLKDGMILLAPDDYHMKIEGDGTVVLSESKNKNDRHVPSIDVMMKSVAEAFGGDAMGILMTGMGSDGVEGIRFIKKVGGITIAQDEKTSIIYGMNKLAVESGSIDHVVPLEKIAEKIKELV